MTEEVEPILRPNPQRFVLFPIEHHDIWDLYKQSEAQFWVAEDIDFSSDARDWATLKPEEQHFLKVILGFFAAADGMVMENINVNFAREVQLPEARTYYAYQNAMEAIHSEAYSLMIDTLIRDPDEKLRLFHAISEFPCVKKLADWTARWMDASTQPFRVRILAFVINEGLLFQDKFAGVFWFKKRNKLNGVCGSNLLISRDEAGHEEHGILLYEKLNAKVPNEQIEQMVKEAVDIDIEFMTEALPAGGLIGMNVALMSDYVKLVADRLLVRLKCPKVYHVSPNLISDMMDAIGMENKVSQFEHRNHVYQRSSVMPGQTNKTNQYAFVRDSDF